MEGLIGGERKGGQFYSAQTEVEELRQVKRREGEKVKIQEQDGGDS